VVEGFEELYTATDQALDLGMRKDLYRLKLLNH